MKLSCSGCLFILGAGAVVVIGSIILLFVLFTHHLPPRPASAAESEFDAAVANLADPLPETWQPDSKLLGQLQPEAELRDVLLDMRKRKLARGGLPVPDGDPELRIARFALRVPVDFHLNDASSSEGSFGFRPNNLDWNGPQRADKSVPGLLICVQTYHGSQKMPGVAEVLRNRIQWTGGSESDRKLVALDRGRLGDLVWLRGRWNCTSGNIHAQVLKYGAVNENRHATILIEAQDVDPFADDTLKVMEAAIRTFHEAM